MLSLQLDLNKSIQMMNSTPASVTNGDSKRFFDLSFLLMNQVNVKYEKQLVAERFNIHDYFIYICIQLKSEEDCLS